MRAGLLINKPRAIRPTIFDGKSPALDPAMIDAAPSSALMTLQIEPIIMRAIAARTKPAPE